MRAQRRRPGDNRGRGWSDTAKDHQKLEETRKDSPLELPENVWPREHLQTPDL